VLLDAATFGLIEHKTSTVFGEFSSKFASCAKAAPHLEDPDVLTSDVGTHPLPVADESIDLYALTHNETSTAWPWRSVGPMVPHSHRRRRLVAVDATSGAGGLRVDPAEFDAYYLAPQKCFASDGASGWRSSLPPPPSASSASRRRAAGARLLGPQIALTIPGSTRRTTRRTRHIFLFAEQLDWLNGGGGLEWRRDRCDRSAEILYTWAERSDSPSPSWRSRGPQPRGRDHRLRGRDRRLGVAKVLRSNGIVDTEPYRKLGRTTAHRHVPGHRARRHRRPLRAINYVVGALA